MSEETEALRQALVEAQAKGYLDHHRACPLNFQRKKCGCGYEEFVARLNAILAPSPDPERIEALGQLAAVVTMGAILGGDICGRLTLPSQAWSGCTKPAGHDGACVSAKANRGMALDRYEEGQGA